MDGKGDKITLVKADEKGEVTFDEIVGAGKQDGKASIRFYAFALDTKETVELAPVPGGGNQHSAYHRCWMAGFMYSAAGMQWLY